MLSVWVARRIVSSSLSGTGSSQNLRRGIANGNLVRRRFIPRWRIHRCHEDRVKPFAGGLCADRRALRVRLDEFFRKQAATLRGIDFELKERLLSPLRGVKGEADL